MNFSGKILLLFMLLAISVTTNAQSITFSGVVQDSHTKEPVAYSSVYFSQSGIGKISDSLGHFSFYISQFTTDTLIVSYIGYETFKLPLDSAEDNKTIIIQLERAKPINEVVIRGKKLNRGLLLWRKIMAKKKLYNRANYANYAYEAYNKIEIDIKNFKADRLKKNFILKPFAFVFDNIDSTSEKDPFLPTYLVESISDYSYQKSPKRTLENIKASSTKGFNNESFSKLLGVMNQNVNVYDNFVTIMDKEFIGPFNDNADGYYTFSTPDTQVVDGKKLYHFVFAAKRAGTTAFQGDAWIMEKTYQIQRISLYLSKDANINYIDRISVFQEFQPVNDSVYFLSRDKFFADFNVMGKKALTLIGRKTTSYRNIIIDNDSVAAVLKNQPQAETITTVPQVNAKTDEEWEKLRHDTLSSNEKAIYATVDKLLQMPKFNRLQKQLRFLATGYKDVGNLEIGPWFNWVSSNTWEGTRLRFDLGTNPGFNKNIYLHGYAAYGTTDHKFKGKAEAYWIVKRFPKRFALHVSGTDDIDNGISRIGQVSQDNIFSIAIRKPNAKRKFLEFREINFDVYNELGKGFSSQVFLSSRQYTPLRNLPFKDSFALAGTAGEPLNSFAVAAILRFAYLEQFLEGDYFRYSLGTRYPIVELMVEQGIPGVLKSAYNYTKLSLSVKDVVKISPYGSFSYKAYAGKIYGTAPFTFLENHPGNDLYYYNTSAFNLMYRFQYLSDQYAGLNIEHNFGSGIFRFTAITRKLKWRQFWNAKMLWGSLNSSNMALNNPDNNKFFRTLNGQSYIEVGTGIDNILKILRLDFVWRLAPSSTIDPQTPKFGVFGSFHFQF